MLGSGEQAVYRERPAAGEVTCVPMSVNCRRSAARLAEPSSRRVIRALPNNQADALRLPISAAQSQLHTDAAAERSVGGAAR